MSGLNIKMLTVLGIPVPSSAISFSTKPIGDVILGNGQVNFSGNIVFDIATVSIVGTSTAPSGTQFDIGDKRYTVLSIIKKGELTVGSNSLSDYEVVGIDLVNKRINV